MKNYKAETATRNILGIWINEEVKYNRTDDVVIDFERNKKILDEAFVYFKEKSVNELEEKFGNIINMHGNYGFTFIEQAKKANLTFKGLECLVVLEPDALQFDVADDEGLSGINYLYFLRGMKLQEFYEDAEFWAKSITRITNLNLEN